jgi:predicted DNA-binding transcriptional regulator AlpA
MITGAVRQYRAVQVAELLSVSVREVWRLVARGELAQPVKIGRCAVWFESDVVEFQARLRAQRERKAA